MTPQRYLRLQFWKYVKKGYCECRAGPSDYCFGAGNDVIDSLKLKKLVSTEESNFHLLIFNQRVCG
jgi:hypothetical protein